MVNIHEFAVVLFKLYNLDYNLNNKSRHFKTMSSAARKGKIGHEDHTNFSECGKGDI